MQHPTLIEDRVHTKNSNFLIGARIITRVVTADRTVVILWHYIDFYCLWVVTLYEPVCGDAVLHVERRTKIVYFDHVIR